jgi:hypothetical protein
MKRLNFSKIKKAGRNFVKNFAKLFKKNLSQEKIVTEKNKAPSGNYKLRKGGYKHYTHRLIPLNKRHSIIYTSFNKQKLPGCMYIDGVKRYIIEKNPHYAFS